MTVVDDSADLPEGAPEAPGELGESGRSLWESLAGEFDLAVHERLVLLQACRIADRLDRLALEASISDVTVENAKGDQVAHPALTESRQQANVLTRLIASLRIPESDPDDDLGGPGAGRPQRRGAARGSYGVRKAG